VERLSAPLLYITGTNTGVGKTTLARLLLQRARERKIQIATLKPFCSGGRDDAEQLHSLQTANLTLDEVNPFYFDEPISPYVAARLHQKAISLAQAIAAIQKVLSRNFPTLIEGAGGLLSPLGEKFTLLDILHELPGKVCIVGPNSLGVINAALLTHRALGKISTGEVRFVLMNGSQPDASSGSNASIIRDWTGAPTSEFPFLAQPERAATNAGCLEVLDDLIGWFIQ
jgi:dethiobiotin synthetase